MSHILMQLAQTIDTSSLPNHTSDAAGQSAITTVLSIVFAITGSIALLIIVIGGFRYVVSHGDPNSVSQAKKAILYAVIGLLVSLAAFSIVNFVVGRVTS